MDITGNVARQSVVQWAERIRSWLEKRGDVSFTREIDEAIKQYNENRFVLTILGQAKRGKSTFVNALLGRGDEDVAPVDKMPATSVITRFVWNEKESATVHFQDGRKDSVAYANIKEYVMEEHNPGNRKEVAMVEVGGPFRGMDRDLILVDSPGSGMLDHHDQILHACIPQSDAVIFLVTASQPIAQDELDLLKKVQAADIKKVFFAINKVDATDKGDIEDGLTHNRKLLAQIGLNVGTIYRISAKQAFQGDMAGSGIVDLSNDLRKFLETNKGAILTARLISRVSQLVMPSAQALAVELANSQRSATDIATDLGKLNGSKREIERERPLLEREFTNTWAMALDEFENNLRVARNAVETKVQKVFAETGALKVGNLSKDLPTLLTSTLDEEMAPRAQKLEQSLKKATEKLQSEYPSIEIRDTGEIAIRVKKSDNTMVIGAIGGTATAAVGIGVAAAAAAAAAAAVTTVAVPTALGSLLGAGAAIASTAGFAPLAAILGGLAPLGIGTATVSTAPLWIAIAGPVGWTLGALGLLAVPFAWRHSKIKLRDKLETASHEQIATIFNALKTERVPALRKMAHSILEDFRLRYDRQIGQIEAALVKARDEHPRADQIEEMQRQATHLQALLAEQSVGRQV